MPVLLSRSIFDTSRVVSSAELIASNAGCVRQQVEIVIASIVVGKSASSRCLNCGDIDLLHRHHRFEGTLCITSARRKCIG